MREISSESEVGVAPNYQEFGKKEKNSSTHGSESVAFTKKEIADLKYLKMIFLTKFEGLTCARIASLNIFQKIKS